MEKIRDDNSKFYIVLVTLLCGLILVIYAAQLSVPTVTDESLSMSTAAWATGRDWSLLFEEFTKRFYRYLQPLMTAPLFAWLNDPEMIYRITMILQALLYTSIIPIIYLICRRHLRMESARLASFIAAAVFFIPSIALYVLYYRGDFLMMTLPWYVILFFLETVRAQKEGKKGRRALFTFLSVVCSYASYMAHTRGIVLLIALLLAALLVRILMKQKSIDWIFCLVLIALLYLADQLISAPIKEALYSTNEAGRNTLGLGSIQTYLDLFSYDKLKSLVMVCLSWLNTLFATTEGLVAVGGTALLVIGIRLVRKKIPAITDEEKILALFSFLIFVGFFLMGALFFRQFYLPLANGTGKSRVDRLLYDRYAITGAGPLIFLALYVLCCRREWLGKKAKIFCVAAVVLVFGVFLWKIIPIVGRNKGLVYHIITLNTFQNIIPSQITSNISLSKTGLVASCLLGLGLLILILILSVVKKKQMPYILLSLVLIGELGLFHVNYVKVRKAANDYRLEASEDVVSLLEEFEDQIAEEYPYVGKLSGAGIQRYQGQLLNYRMFGKDMEESLNLDNYFIICKHGDIDLTWYENDYYLFDVFDYENAEHDMLYVKGDELAEALEEAGYTMISYVPDEAGEDVSTEDMSPAGN